jgi:hypothetical protein
MESYENHTLGRYCPYQPFQQMDALRSGSQPGFITEFSCKARKAVNIVFCIAVVEAL